jgi:predicted O-methyltransferase YrrM
MKIITKEDILNHEDLFKSVKIAETISKNVSGYMCHEMVHILYVLKEMMGEDCKNYVEIGTHNGGSIITTMQSAHKTKFLGLDAWPRMGDMTKTVENIDKHNTHNHEYELIKGDSTKDETLEKVTSIVDSVDLLFIDGGHEYDVVINDFERYSKLVSKNGIIVFDDYLMFEKPNPFNAVEKKRKGQVRLAVDDIVEKYSDSYNIIGILPNKAEANTKIGIDYNVSFIMQKL